MAVVLGHVRRCRGESDSHPRRHKGAGGQRHCLPRHGRVTVVRHRRMLVFVLGLVGMVELHGDMRYGCIHSDAQHNGHMGKDGRLPRRSDTIYIVQHRDLPVLCE